VLVTHDLLDAVALGDRMVVIEDARSCRRDTRGGDRPPRSRYVADLVGVNLLRGTAHGTMLELDGGGELICAEPATGLVLAVIAPAGVSVAPAAARRQEHNTGQGRSAQSTSWRRVRVRMTARPDHSEVPARVDELKLDDGGELWASIDRRHHGVPVMIIRPAAARRALGRVSRPFSPRRSAGRSPYRSPDRE